MKTTDETRRIRDALLRDKEMNALLRPRGWTDIEGAFCDHALHVLPAYVKCAEILRKVSMQTWPPSMRIVGEARDALADLDALGGGDG